MKPVDPTSTEDSDSLDAVLERLAAKGEVRLRTRDDKPNWSALRPSVSIDDIASDELLDELRKDTEP